MVWNSLILFQRKKIWIAIEEILENAFKFDKAEIWSKADFKIQYIISICIDSEDKKQIKGCKTAKEK